MQNAILGAIGGAVGTMALDISSYGDMALRGRGSSNVPAEVVRRLAEKSGIKALAIPDERADPALKNRRSALGALSGYSVGVAIGVVYGAAHPYVKKLPTPLVAVALGALVMAATDTTAARLGATDPKQWGVSGWVSDVIPHLAYGFTTVLVVDALSSDQT